MPGLIPPETIAEIRSRVDIAQVVGENVQLVKSGASLKGLCPFHNERTPSFYVHPQKQFFHCFGCGEKGDVFTFVVRMTGGTFAEAARALAERAGVGIAERERTPHERREDSLRAALLDVSETAAVFFQAVLAGREPGGEAGTRYLERRGLEAKVVSAFRLGFAPDSWDALARHLEKRRVPALLAEQTGLVRRRKDKGSDRPMALAEGAVVSAQTHFDFFRGRLMFPVITPAGEAVAFSGRIVAGAQGEGTSPPSPRSGEAQPSLPPKYINSPESPLYKKGRMLFGLHAARAAIHKKGRALLVEGNVDVMTLHQAGLEEAVAPLGTAMTPEQAEVLRRQTRQVVLATDGDAAGRKAAEKDIPLLVAAGLDVRLLPLPKGEDPDSLTRRIGGAEMAARVDGAKDAILYLVGELAARAGGAEAPAGRRTQALAELAPVLAAIPAPEHRDMYIGQVAQALGMDAATARATLRKAYTAGRMESARGRAPGSNPIPNGEGRAPTLPVAPRTADDGRASAGRQTLTKGIELIALLLEHPDLAERAVTQGVEALLGACDGELGPAISAFFSRICVASRDGGVGSVPSLLDEAPPPLRERLAKSCISGQYQRLEEPARALSDLVSALVRDRVDRELARTRRELAEAERAQDVPRQHELLERVVQLSQELSRVRNAQIG